jgi:hypothetical protein
MHLLYPLTLKLPHSVCTLAGSALSLVLYNIQYQDVTRPTPYGG